MNIHQKPFHKNESSIRDWIWALAFVWMLVLCSAGYFLLWDHGAIDRFFLYLLFLAAPIVCWIAAVKVSRRAFPLKNLWVLMNAIVPIGAVLALIWVLLLLGSLTRAWK